MMDENSLSKVENGGHCLLNQALIFYRAFSNRYALRSELSGGGNPE